MAGWAHSMALPVMPWRGGCGMVLVVFAIGCSGGPTAPSFVPSPSATVPPVTPPPVATVPPVVVTPAPNPLLSDPRFDRTYYAQLAHGTFDYPGVTLSLQRWTRPPLIYIRTLDQSGAPVPAALLDQTAAAIINTAGQWTGGQFGVAGLEQGTSTREGQHGWITVTWATTGVCGLANATGSERGVTITLNRARPECTCGPLVIKHELGHALGYHHTASQADLMATTFQGVCDKPLSAREAFHAQVAYTQPVGSSAP